ncbi:Bug family tripartite tricarboxylate transporter substrate binding protein [Streptomyces corynorhini]|uniref:Tripartite tricarboxylate transporter substrate binding protein n=1 Tax=Streptomyces corynorhini TaxID=2282652 RepID=A0A370B6G8_9ACTN|nr:tripartite tricarboxylate transporter substrate-binding protein [Streptomyces corynorhini]RDG37390.1 tripartite tricarboxylate transporter substrate binding protein [Streptomyces corynorhini]
MVTVRITALLGVLVIGPVLTLGGCVGGPWDRPGGGGGWAAEARIMAPNAPGGGYDSTARTVARVMEETGIAPGVQVFNLPGAGGTVGLQRLVDERGNGELAMQMGLGVVGASYVSGSRVTLAQTTPIARLIEEAGAIVVARDSPYTSIGELVAAWRAEPGKVSVGGGSSPGGPDHLLPMRLAKAVGLDPGVVDYHAYEGGGELLTAVMDGRVTFGASGYGEFLDQVAAGQLRVLAVTSTEPVGVLRDVPTLKASGIDLVFANWRGIVAPPGIGARERARWTEALDRMRRSARWRAELARHGWSDAFLTGERFADYLTEQDRATAEILSRLGLMS